MQQLILQAGAYQPPPSTPTFFPYLLRPDPSPKRGDADPRAKPRDETKPASAKAVVCRQCLHIISSTAERRDINGAHAHTFANPEGIVFEIVCYRSAWGCGYVGPASPEFTWFTGYVWRIAVCANCHIHLGWRFSASDGHFFHGLISSRVIVAEMQG
jgi:hypothetical protein